MKRHAFGLIAVVVMLVACTGGTGSTSATAERVASGADASHWIPPLPSEIRGTWRTGTAELALTACAVGTECGHLVRVDENGERCVYALSFLSAGADGYRYATGMGNSFGCGWSAWSNGVVHLTVDPNGGVKVAVDGVRGTHIVMRPGVEG